MTAHHVFLVGFMGCGKSTVGLLLGERLRIPFLDLDDRIEADQKSTILEIFQSSGEPFFRQIESRLLEDLCAGKAAVVALGGGALTVGGNRELLSRHGVTIWLKAPLQLVEERCADQDHRPLARDREQLRRLFSQREPLYRTANLQVEVAGKTPDQISDEIGLMLDS